MSTPQPVHVQITGSATTFYTAWVGTVPLPSRAMLVSLDLTNTNATDSVVDVWYENAAGSTLRYFAKSLTVPAGGTASYRGMQSIDTVSDKFRAQCTSGTSVDAVGTVIENA